MPVAHEILGDGPGEAARARGSEEALHDIAVLASAVPHPNELHGETRVRATVAGVGAVGVRVDTGAISGSKRPKNKSNTIQYHTYINVRMSKEQYMLLLVRSIELYAMHDQESV